MALKRIEDLDAAVSVDGTESVELDTGYRTTLQDIADLAGSSGSDDVDVVVEASAFTATVVDHSGRGRLVLAGNDVTFNSTETYSTGKSFNIRATGDLSLIETGVTLTPPSGGTLDLLADMAVTVVFTGSTTAVVIGQTVPV